MSHHKTPVSLLQEICAKRGITPFYELVSHQGLTHEPIYVYKSTAGEWIAQAKGSSKKKAKHYVALLILIQMVKTSLSNSNDANRLFIEEIKSSASGLLGRNDAYDIITSELSYNNHGNENVFDVISTDNPLLCPVNEEEMGNPIGELQELCQKNMWPQPNYDFTLYQNKHETTCSLKLWKWTVTATGKSRKLAKRKAALNMMKKLSLENLTIPKDMLDMLEEGTLKLHDDDDIDGVDGSGNVGTGIGGPTEPGRQSSLATQIQRSYGRNLRGIYNCKDEIVQDDLLSLGDVDDPDELNDRLEAFCQQHKLSLLYTYISRTTSGTVYCLLQLNSSPAQVVRGKGSTLEEARRNATARGFEFLCNMVSPVPLRDVTVVATPVETAVLVQE